MGESRCFIILGQPLRPTQSDGFVNGYFDICQLFRRWKVNETTLRFCHEIRDKRGLDPLAGVSAARAGCAFVVVMCSKLTSYLHPCILFCNVENAEIPASRRRVERLWNLCFEICLNLLRSLVQFPEA